MCKARFSWVTEPVDMEKRIVASYGKFSVRPDSIRPTKSTPAKFSHTALFFVTSHEIYLLFQPPGIMLVVSVIDVINCKLKVTCQPACPLMNCYTSDVLFGCWLQLSLMLRFTCSKDNCWCVVSELWPPSGFAGACLLVVVAKAKSNVRLKATSGVCTYPKKQKIWQDIHDEGSFLSTILMWRSNTGACPAAKSLISEHCDSNYLKTYDYRSADISRCHQFLCPLALRFCT